MNALSTVGMAMAGVGISTAVYGGGGLVLGLATGGLSGINKPNDGYADVKPNLKLLGAGIGVTALGGTAAAFLGARSNNPAAMAAGGVALIGGFMTFVGGLGAGIQIAD